MAHDHGNGVGVCAPFRTVQSTEAYAITFAANNNINVRNSHEHFVAFWISPFHSCQKFASSCIWRAIAI